MRFFYSGVSINMKDVLKNHGYKIISIIEECENSIKFREYVNCCSNEYKTAKVKRNVILIYNNKNEIVDRIKV